MNNPSTKAIQRYFQHMPLLDHYPNRNTNKPFSFYDSQVVQWMISNEPLMQYLFQAAKNKNGIIFDPNTKLWRGCKTDLLTRNSSRLLNASSKRNFMTTLPSSKYQNPPLYKGDSEYNCEDRQTPNPFTHQNGNFEDRQNDVEVEQ